MATDCLDSQTVQGSMAINGIIGSGSSSSAGVSNSFSSGRANIRSNDTNPISDDATSVKFSASEKSKTTGVESAIRYLAPLQSVVETASSATNRANEVLNQSLNIAKKVAIEVDPTKRAVLASDGAALLGELDKIASTTTPDGVSVIGQGSVSYSLSLDKQGESKGNSITINIPDIQISKSALGLSSVNSTTLKNSNSSSQTSLQQAIDTVSNIAAALKSTLTSILDTAESNGTSRAAQGAVNEGNAGELADKIAAAIKNSKGFENSNNLEATKVLELIKTPEENKNQNETALVQAKKDKKVEDLSNPILASDGLTPTSREESF